MKWNKFFLRKDLEHMVMGTILVITLLILTEVNASGPTCITWKYREAKPNVIANCTFMNLKAFKDIPSKLPADSVVFLDLSYNGLEVLLHESFVVYSELWKLILSHNEIKYVERKSFSSLKSLTAIDLSYNKLETIQPDIFSENLELSVLSLASNPLVYVPNDSPILISSSLIYLDLSNCGLTSVSPSTFSRLPELINLNLTNNYLRTISFQTLKTMNRLRIIELMYNRWSCNCSILDTLSWCYILNIDIRVEEPLKCFERGNYKVLWNKDEFYSSYEKSIEENHNISGEIDDFTVVCDDGFKAAITLPEESNDDDDDDEHTLSEFNVSSELYTTSDIYTMDLPEEIEKNRTDVEYEFSDNREGLESQSILNRNESKNLPEFNVKPISDQTLAPGTPNMHLIAAEDILTDLSSANDYSDLDESLSDISLISDEDTLTDTQESSEMYLDPNDDISSALDESTELTNDSNIYQLLDLLESYDIYPAINEDTSSDIGELSSDLIVPDEDFSDSRQSYILSTIPDEDVSNDLQDYPDMYPLPDDDLSPDLQQFLKDHGYFDENSEVGQNSISDPQESAEIYTVVNTNLQFNYPESSTNEDMKRNFQEINDFAEDKEDTWQNLYKGLWPDEKGSKIKGSYSFWIFLHIVGLLVLVSLIVVIGISLRFILCSSFNYRKVSGGVDNANFNSNKISFINDDQFV